MKGRNEVSTKNSQDIYHQLCGSTADFTSGQIPLVHLTGQSLGPCMEIKCYITYFRVTERGKQVDSTFYWIPG